jgi:hypothetical protein
VTQAEKAAFDLMYENLRKLQKHDREMRQNHGYGFANYVCKLIDSAVSTAHAALAAADAVAEQGQPKPLGWYCVSNDGMATLCADGDDASQVAKEADFLWPRHGPHKAMQLCEYQYSTPKE